jgi:hypothetical protein
VRTPTEKDKVKASFKLSGELLRAEQWQR